MIAGIDIEYIPFLCFFIGGMKRWEILSIIQKDLVSFYAQHVDNPAKLAKALNIDKEDFHRLYKMHKEEDDK